MGGVITSLASSLVFGITWCFCTAAGSVCGAACGNDKPSTTAPSATSGRKRSAFLFLISVGLSFAFQYGVARALGPDSNALTSIPYAGPYLVQAWTSGCNYSDSNLHSNASVLEEVCRQNNGVYRVSACTWLFFVLLAVAAKCKPSFNREVWPAKYVLFLIFVTASAFIPNTPLFTPIYLQFSRVCAAIFVILQQLIYIDIGYDWNDSWVTKSNDAEAEEIGSGKKWLAAILITCGIFFSASITGVALLFHYFGGCTTNKVFVSLTLIFSLIVTIVQLLGEEASLLTSAILSLYATYLCYSSVSANPDPTCNPYYERVDALNIAIGVGMTFISLAWTGFSWTASETLSKDNTNNAVESSPLRESERDSKVTGLVTSADTAPRDHDNETDEAISSNSSTWKLNAILAFLAAWYAMVLTGWGSIADNGNEANPTASRVSMWIIIGSQWLVFTLYLWSLVAPRLFPDRDFS